MPAAKRPRKTPDRHGPPKMTETSWSWKRKRRDQVEVRRTVTTKWLVSSVDVVHMRPFNLLERTFGQLELPL
jgi:hypothetical protein